MSIADKFHRSYSVAENGCWNWNGKTTQHGGYGRFWTGERTVRAHRWSYESVNGPLGESVCRHKCDNPKCVNPAHLLPGTQADNIADAKARGRLQRGERQGGAKLTEADVRLIRESPDKLTEIAAKFGIGVSTASQIRNRHRWGHVQ